MIIGITIKHFTLILRFWDNRNGKITSSVTTAAARNKQYLCATWAPNGHEVVATSTNNYNVLIDTRKSAVVKAVQANAEVRPPCSPALLL